MTEQSIEGRVLFESIVDASLIDEKGALTTSIAATDDARSAAASCSLVPQLDALGGTAKANDWRVADLTRLLRPVRARSRGAAHLRPAVDRRRAASGRVLLRFAHGPCLNRTLVILTILIAI